MKRWTIVLAMSALVVALLWTLGDARAAENEGAKSIHGRLVNWCAEMASYAELGARGRESKVGPEDMAKITKFNLDRSGLSDQSKRWAWNLAIIGYQATDPSAKVRHDAAMQCIDHFMSHPNDLPPDVTGADDTSAKHEG